MRNVTHRMLVAAVVAILFAASFVLPGTRPQAARAASRVNASFTFTTLDVPNSTSTAANGNSTHEIAGQFDDASGTTHGFVLNKGVYTTIDVPNAVATNVNGINANGELAGTYIDDTFHAYFMTKSGDITMLVPPGSIRSQSGFLNAQGQPRLRWNTCPLTPSLFPRRLVGRVAGAALRAAPVFTGSRWVASKKEGNVSGTIDTQIQHSTCSTASNPEAQSL